MRTPSSLLPGETENPLDREMTIKEEERTRDSIALLVRSTIEKDRQIELFHQEGFQEKCRAFFESKNNPEIHQLLRMIDKANSLFREKGKSNCHSFSEYITGGENHIGSTLYTGGIKHRNYKTPQECLENGWIDLKVDKNGYFPDELDILNDNIGIPCEGYLLHHEDRHSFILLGKMEGDYIVYEQPGYGEQPRFMFYSYMRRLYSGKVFFRPLRF